MNGRTVGGAGSVGANTGAAGMAGGTVGDAGFAVVGLAPTGDCAGRVGGVSRRCLSVARGPATPGTPMRHATTAAPRPTATATPTATTRLVIRRVPLTSGAPETWPAAMKGVVSAAGVTSTAGAGTDEAADEPPLPPVTKRSLSRTYPSTRCIERFGASSPVSSP